MGDESSWQAAFSSTLSFIWHASVIEALPRMSLTHVVAPPFFLEAAVPKIDKRTAFLVVTVAFIALLTAGGSTGGTLANGRSVTANSYSWSLQSRFSPDSATIDTAGHTIVVAPKQLSVDGKIVARINESVKTVAVNVQRGAITFVADGKTVATHTR